MMGWSCCPSRPVPILIKNRYLSESVEVELADDGRPAPATLPGDCCGSAAAHSVAGRIQKRLETDQFRVWVSRTNAQAAKVGTIKGLAVSPAAAAATSMASCVAALVDAACGVLFSESYAEVAVEAWIDETVDRRAGSPTVN